MLFEEGFVCYLNGGGDSLYMLVKRRKRRVMLKVLEFGVIFLGGYNRFYWVMCKIFFFNKLFKME